MRPLICLGSSTSEVFDYIFGNHSNYHPFWASGWTMRGLSKQRTLQYIKHIMKDMPRDSNIFLNFGTVDVDFSLQYKAKNTGFYDFEFFKTQMISSSVLCHEFLESIGFQNVYFVFPAPPVPVSPEYYYNCFSLVQLPANMRGKILHDVAMKLSEKFKVINILPELSARGKFFLHPKYCRDYCDHHNDYIKTQYIVYNNIKNIPDLLPRRNIIHNNLYEHDGTFSIHDLQNTLSVRHRTCR